MFTHLATSSPHPRAMSKGIPILTYHALHAPGWDYHSNDHVALERDLLLIRELGLRVIGLGRIVDALLDGRVDELAEQRVVGLSFDDGPDHDFRDFSHPGYGLLKSMDRVLAEQGFELGHPDGDAVATSFVIVSPQARTQLDARCIAGRGQWSEDWWQAAVEAGRIQIGSHSWDHLHPALDDDVVVARRAQRGRFDSVCDREDAEREIGAAEAYLRERLGDRASGLFAYPYGAWSPFLVSEYFPSQQQVRAAFTTGGRHVQADDCRWRIPRYVCQEHWHTPEQLRAILAACRA